MNIRAILQSNTFIQIAIVLVGILFFVGYVWADTSSTTVTVGNEAPSLAVTLDRTTITPIENTYMWASTTVTVTDNNGCSEITNVEAYLVHATSSAESVVQTCSYDAQTCYVPTGGCVATTTGTTCGSTVVQYDCGFQVWYNARPTDVAPGLTTSFWYVVASSTDGSLSGTATNTTQTVNVSALNALDLSGNITYPQTSANSDTGATNQTITVTNTGNTNTDNEISGDVMCTDYSACTGSTFGVGQQKFDLDEAPSADYSDLAYTLAATSSPATIEMDLATSTATTTAITGLTYWGIAIPASQAAGDYTGQNTFSAVAD